MNITFFGHRDTPYSIAPVLEQTIKELLKSNENITCYVGTHGNFDVIAQKALAKLSAEYSQLSYYIVLAYKNNPYEGLPTILPEGIEFSHPKSAIPRRNEWMVNRSDAVICYVTREHGGAARFVELARENGKKIINLSTKK